MFCQNGITNNSFLIDENNDTRFSFRKLIDNDDSIASKCRTTQRKAVTCYGFTIEWHSMCLL